MTDKILITAKDINNVKFYRPLEKDYNILFNLKDSKYFLYALFTDEDYKKPKLFEISKETYNELNNEKFIVILVSSKRDLNSVIKDSELKVKDLFDKLAMVNYVKDAIDNMTLEERLKMEADLKEEK